MYILYQISYSYITFVPENKGFENNGIISPYIISFSIFCILNKHFCKISWDIIERFCIIMEYFSVIEKKYVRYTFYYFLNEGKK